MRTGVKRVLITAPTGSGKTLLTAHMLREAARRGKRSIFVVHRKVLVRQAARAFESLGEHVGVIAAGFKPCPGALIQIASIGTLARRLGRLSMPDLVVWDECHHIAAKSWSDTFAALPDAYHIGLTATPCRLDGKGLRPYFDAIVNGPSVKLLIAQGYLSDYRLYGAPALDLSGVKRVMGDYSKREAEKRVSKPTITGCAVAHYKKYCNNKRAIVFCISIAHSKRVAEAFNLAGVRAEHVDGRTNDTERDAAIGRFENGPTLVLCNVDLFGEGFDVPGIQAVILLRPTQSTSLAIQQPGRGLRPAPEKDYAIILDHVGNYERHGLPDDEGEWSLDGIKRGIKASSTEPSVRICEVCFGANRGTDKRCRYCGAEVIVKERVVKQSAGELKRIERERKKAEFRTERAQAGSFAELVEFGKRQGMKHPAGYAWHVWRSRGKR